MTDRKPVAPQRPRPHAQDTNGRARDAELSADETPTGQIPQVEADLQERVSKAQTPPRSPAPRATNGSARRPSPVAATASPPRPEPRPTPAPQVASPSAPLAGIPSTAPPPAKDETPARDTPPAPSSKAPAKAPTPTKAPTPAKAPTQAKKVSPSPPASAAAAVPAPAPVASPEPPPRPAETSEASEPVVPAAKADSRRSTEPAQAPTAQPVTDSLDTVVDQPPVAPPEVSPKKKSSREDKHPTRSRKESKRSTPADTVAASASTSSGTRKAHLRLVRVDPWSVLKIAFALSMALAIVTIVAMTIVWAVLGAAGVWDAINSSVATVMSDNTDAFDITRYVGFGRIIGLTIVIAAADVLLITAIATVGAFLYNLAAGLLGGLEVTLAEDS